MRRAAVLLFLLLPLAQARVEENVVYGMRSGLAMLMDVHYPERSNGLGIIFIPGSGWYAPLDYSAPQLKDSGFAKSWGRPLIDAGYTVFVVNHRASPRFQHPAALEDVQRAVRFVRAHAERFGIDPERIGGVGASSGGHLIAMLGVVDAPGVSSSDDLVERQSGKLQAVMARAAPTNLTKSPNGNQATYIGLRLHDRDKPGSPEFDKYWQASPAAHVSPDDAPFLLIHGDADERVPYERSVEFQALLSQMGVEAELIRVPGGGHGDNFTDLKNPPDRVKAMVRWFDKQLVPRNAKSVAQPPPPPANAGVERNVVFGMVSGGALLMDVYRPSNPNGFAVLHITGSGWHTSLAPGAAQQKASAQVGAFGLPLVKAGYTVFAVNHRAAPWHKYPAQLEDVQRAVRFIRHNAARWSVNPDRIGGVGGSSGGHLTAMLGLHDGAGDPDDPDPVNRLSAKLQCILPWAPPVDLPAMNLKYGNPSFASWLGTRLMATDAKTSYEYRLYREASPIEYVSADDPPTLMIHGDADASVPISQSEALLAKLKAVGVPSDLIPVPGGGHGAQFPGKRAGAPDYIAAMVRWFDQYLKR